MATLYRVYIILLGNYEPLVDRLPPGWDGAKPTLPSSEKKKGRPNEDLDFPSSLSKGREGFFNFSPLFSFLPVLPVPEARLKVFLLLFPPFSLSLSSPFLLSAQRKEVGEEAALGGLVGHDEEGRREGRKAPLLLPLLRSLSQLCCLLRQGGGGKRGETHFTHSIKGLSKSQKKGKKKKKDCCKKTKAFLHLLTALSYVLQTDEGEFVPQTNLSSLPPPSSCLPSLLTKAF